MAREVEYKAAYENVMIANKMLRQENKELKKTIEKIKEHIEEYGNDKFKVVFGIHILKIIGGKNE